MTDAAAYPSCKHGRKIYERCTECEADMKAGIHGGFERAAPSSKDVMRWTVDMTVCGNVRQDPEGALVRYDDFKVVMDSHRWLYAEKARLEEQLRTAIPAIATLKRTRDELEAALGSNAPETEAPLLAEICALRGELELTVEHLEAANSACEGASKRLDEMTAEFHRIRPKADAYERVCQTLGIDSDILGYIAKLKQGETSGEHHGLDNARQVFFYEQDFYVLSNFSAFTIYWSGRRFDTSEQLYHWLKFSNDPGVQQLIFDAESAHVAFKLAEQYRARRRPDWDEKKVLIMRDVLRAKALQHDYVRRKLLATGDRELIENSWRDDFWGWGPNRNGQNMLGKLWMEIRAELRSPEKSSDEPASRDAPSLTVNKAPQLVTAAPECPKCRTQLAFEGDECGLCKEDA